MKVSLDGDNCFIVVYNIFRRHHTDQEDNWGLASWPSEELIWNATASFSTQDWRPGRPTCDGQRKWLHGMWVEAAEMTPHSVFECIRYMNIVRLKTSWVLRRTTRTHLKPGLEPLCSLRVCSDIILTFVFYREWWAVLLNPPYLVGPSTSLSLLLWKQPPTDVR